MDVSPRCSCRPGHHRDGISQVDVPAVFRLGKIKELDLFETTIDVLQECYASGVLTSVEYVEHCLQRIHNVRMTWPSVVAKATQSQSIDPFLQINPYIESVIEVNPDAIQIAEALDDERRLGNIRGRLHGIPILVKDVRRTIFYSCNVTDGRRIW